MGRPVLIGGLLRCCMASLREEEARVAEAGVTLKKGDHVPCAFGCKAPEGGATLIIHEGELVWTAAWTQKEPTT